MWLENEKVIIDQLFHQLINAEMSSSKICSTTAKMMTHRFVSEFHTHHTVPGKHLGKTQKPNADVLLKSRKVLQSLEKNW